MLAAADEDEAAAAETAAAAVASASVTSGKLHATRTASAMRRGLSSSQTESGGVGSGAQACLDAGGGMVLTAASPVGLWLLAAPAAAAPAVLPAEEGLPPAVPAEAPWRGEATEGAAAAPAAAEAVAATPACAAASVVALADAGAEPFRAPRASSAQEGCRDSHGSRAAVAARSGAYRDGSTSAALPAHPLAPAPATAPEATGRAAWAASECRQPPLLLMVTLQPARCAGMPGAINGGSDSTAAHPASLAAAKRDARDGSAPCDGCGAAAVVAAVAAGGRAAAEGESGSCAAAAAASGAGGLDTAAAAAADAAAAPPKQHAARDAAAAMPAGDRRAGPLQGGSGGPEATPPRPRLRGGLP